MYTIYMDPYKFLQITPNSDGSLTRLAAAPTVPFTAVSTAADHSLYKDISLNPKNDTFIRIFMPKNPRKNTKLPVLLDFHGGGFILYSATTQACHESCSYLASQLPALILSVEYRLAPEHRLPAAYDDAVEAIMWLRDQALEIDGCDAWLRDHADFSNCFLIGISAGASIVYHAGIRALDLDILPLRINGLIINQPFFGAVERTKSERVGSSNEPMLLLPVTDLMWSLALPLDADRDHEYSYPTIKPDDRGKIKRLEKCMIRGHGGDPLIDRQREFAKMLESCGVHVVTRFYDEGHHSVEYYDPNKYKSLYKDIKDFIFP